MGKTSKPRNSSEKLSRQVVVLRARGLTYHQIGQRFGVTKQRVQQVYRAWIRPEDDPCRKPRLTEALILAWADEFHKQTGKWPVASAGLVCAGSDETWLNIDSALRQGWRGLPRATSLAGYVIGSDYSLSCGESLVSQPIADVRVQPRDDPGHTMMFANSQ